MIRDSVIVQEQDPRPAVVPRKTIYNPYKKKYVLREPTKRRTKKEEIQFLMQPKENERDHVWIGDEMEEEKKEGTIRIWLQNWNGVRKIEGRNDVISVVSNSR